MANTPNQPSEKELKMTIMDPGTPKAKLSNTKKVKKNKWQKSNNQAKVRVKLPSIESYQKELEFPADAPGRVIVRLERLMGTDKIRITDSKYMSTLLERLEQEENEAWLKRTRERKLAERNRFRQLAVEGLMEPTADMEDLLQHPVFRVNRILNRLSKLDTDITLTPMKKLPPITPVEPFADNRGGGPVRYSFSNAAIVEEEEEEDEVVPESGEFYEEEDEETADEAATEEGEAVQKTAKDNQSDKAASDIEWGGEDYGDTDRLYGPNESLTSAKLRYGIPAGENIEAKCKSYRSQLVDLVFDDSHSGVTEMYETAKDVLGAYKREQQTADDFVVKLNKLL